MDGDRTIKASDIGGISETADTVGVSVSRVHQLLIEDPTFPRPIWYLKVGRLWDLAEVARWKLERRSAKAEVYRNAQAKREEMLVAASVVPKPGQVSAEDRASKLDALFGKRP